MGSRFCFKSHAPYRSSFHSAPTHIYNGRVVFRQRIDDWPHRNVLASGSISLDGAGHNPDYSQLDALFLISCEEKDARSFHRSCAGYVMMGIPASKLCFIRWSEPKCVWLHACVAICVCSRLNSSSTVLWIWWGVCLLSRSRRTSVTSLTWWVLSLFPDETHSCNIQVRDRGGDLE